MNRWLCLLGSGLVSSSLLLFGWELQAGDEADWFPWQPSTDYGPDSRLNLADWLERPAGARGFVQMTPEGGLAFEDGTPVRFWGTNASNRNVFPENADAVQTAEMLAMYGINGLRLHKWTWGRDDAFGTGLTLPESVLEFDPDLLDRMDFFIEKLRERGIYHGWSHIYGTRPKPGDAHRLLAYEEIRAIEVPWRHLSQSTSFLVNFAPDLQDLNIELTVRLLDHHNPHSGLRYADDPALAFIELQNEENIWWGAHETALAFTPTYRALLCRRFSNWLSERYGTEKAWREAWGEAAIPEEESLLAENVYPNPNHSWFDGQFAAAAETGQPPPRHVLDKARYLYEEQMAFYRKFAAAIRETGYRGPIVASCWQAGQGINHFYNLHADAVIGLIDRHNYFGSGTGWRREADGSIGLVTHTSRPGGGLLSTGHQQVLNRPFAFSEWIVTNPNAWAAEGTPLIAAYGMGLQGWDASYSFAFDRHGWPETLGHTWNVRSPMHLGLYPVLSRMVHRGEIREGDLVGVRTVDVAALAKGGTALVDDRVEQDFDFKEFGGFIPPEALAVGKVGVEFDGSGGPGWLADLSPYLEPGVVRSTTGQLTWKTFDGRGRFLIDGPSTAGSVGFSNGTPDQLAELTIRTDAFFAVILVGAFERKDTIAGADRLLVTTMARVRNTGTVYNEDRTEIVEPGTAPLEVEPVRVELAFRRGGSGSVRILDHMGRPTGDVFPFADGRVTLEGAVWKTPYYEIAFD